MSEKEILRKNERDLRLTAFHMAREILTEQTHMLIQTGTKTSAPTTEQIQAEAEKILTFLGGPSKLLILSKYLCFIKIIKFWPGLIAYCLK